MNKSVESILSRSISIASKFLLLTFLAKTLSLSEYGSYQLITYFTMIAISIYGVEYYMYGNREVAKGINNIDKINNHVSFFVTLFPITFLVQIVALFFLIPYDILTPQIFFIIIFVNFCDYFNQEVYRYLIMINKIGKANLLLVLKSSIFLMLIVGYHWANNSLNFNVTLYIMFVSFFILLVITTIFFFRFIIKRRLIKITLLPFDKIGKTLRFLWPFLVLMIFTKGLEFFDKFAIEYFYDLEQVGVYSFLFSIASLIYVFVVSGFYLVYLPRLIKFNEDKDVRFKITVFKFGVLVVISSIALSLGIVLFIDILLEIVGKKDLKESIDVLYILLFAFFFLNISLIPGIVLYIKGKDRLMMYISGIVFFVNVIFNLIFLNLFNVKGAAIALTITYIVNFLITSYKAKSIWIEMKESFL